MTWLTVALTITLVVVVRTTRKEDNHVVISPLDRIVFPSDIQSPLSSEPAETARNIRSRYLRAAEAIFGVAVRLKLFLNVHEDNNFLVSPVSVAAAIGELLLGANGRSGELLEWLLSTENSTSSDKEDILILHRQLGGLVNLLQTNKYGASDGYVLQMASAFFIQKDLKMKPSYVHAVSQLYGLQFYPLDFSANPMMAQDVVNQWTSKHTHGQIQSAVPGGLAATTSTLLLNAVYFKGDWETPFDPELTVPGVFRISASRGVRVDYMRGQIDTLYAESDTMGCRIVALPYKGAQAAMFIVMPLKDRDEFDLQRFLASLTFTNVRDLIASGKKRSVTIALPKMILKDTLSIRRAVTKVRDKLKEKSTPPARASRSVNDVSRTYYHWRYNWRHQYYFSIPTRFDDAHDGESPQTTVPPDNMLDLDMSGASEDLRFRVDDVLHQVVVDISEKGTEAAAVSSSTVDYIGDVKLFKVDSPFLFFVRHELTLASLFWGVIVDPKSGQGEYV